MKILRYKKIGKDKYKISLDNKDELLCYEDVIIKYNLLNKNIIDYELLNKINVDNSYYENYYKAIKYVNVRMRSIYEVRKYLDNKEIEKVVINQVIGKLKKDGYLDDNKFAIAYINTKVNTTDFGPSKIKSGLIKLGVSKDIIGSNMKLFSESKSKEKIEKIIKKEIKSNRKYGVNFLRRKIVSKLISDGYSRDLINEVLSGVDIDVDNNILVRSYEKLIRKYKDDYKVKSKLYELGFIGEEIEKVMK